MAAASLAAARFQWRKRSGYRHRQTGLCDRGHRPRRFRPRRDQHRRDRDARPDGAARGIRRVAAAQGRADHRLAPHDDPDRGADRDADRARRRGPLGDVQHLLDPGPCRRRDRRDRRAGVRDQGREPGRLLGLCRPTSSTGATTTANIILDDGGDATMFALWGAKLEAGHTLRRARERGGGRVPARAEGVHRQAPRLSHRDGQEPQGRLRRDHHRRPPPLRDRQEGRAAVPGDQRQRQRDQVEVRQPLWLQGIAGRRDPPRHRRDARRQGRDCVAGFGDVGKGSAAVAPQRRRARAGHRDRSDLRAAGGDGGLSRS